VNVDVEAGVDFTPGPVPMPTLPTTGREEREDAAVDDICDIVLPRTGAKPEPNAEAFENVTLVIECQEAGYACRGDGEVFRGVIRIERFEDSSIDADTPNRKIMLGILLLRIFT
jgi:hypothetical protein